MYLCIWEVVTAEEHGIKKDFVAKVTKARAINIMVWGAYNVTTKTK